MQILMCDYVNLHDMFIVSRDDLCTDGVSNVGHIYWQMGYEYPPNVILCQFQLEPSGTMHPHSWAQVERLHHMNQGLSSQY